MRWIAVGAVALILIIKAGGRPPAPKQLDVQVRLLEEDPAGGRPRILAQPRLVTLENHPASYLAGGQVKLPVKPGFAETGTRLDVTWRGGDEEGKVSVDVSLTVTLVAEATGEHIQLLTRNTRFAGAVKVGEITKLRWCRADKGPNTWAELRVEWLKGK